MGRFSLRTLFLFGGLPAALGLAIWQGCMVYDPSLLVVGADASDAASDAVNVPDGDGCNHRVWPPPPAADDDAAVDNIEFYNAVQTLDFGAGDGGALPNELIGYDLDGVCTCPGVDSCKPFAEAGTQCDLEGGTDNAAGTLIKEYAGTNSFFDQGYINLQLGNGVFGALFRVRNYNGQANDKSVELSVFTSNGTAGAGTDAGPKVPKFDGTDVWTLDPTSLQGGTLGDAGPIPRVAYDLNAYVSNYTLVGNISDMPLAIGAATGESLITMELSDAHVIAKLTPYKGSFAAVGTVTGRWQSRKLLTALSALNDPFQLDAALCGNDPIYQLIKPRVCSLEDIASSVLNDNKGFNCDALSLAFTFIGVPATYGAVFAKPDGGSQGCGPTWTDQCQ